MGSGKMNPQLAKYVKKNFPDSKADMFAIFIERTKALTKNNGYYALITQHSWMFLSSFEKLRNKLNTDTLINMAHLGTRAFEDIGGEVVQSTAFIMQNSHLDNYVGTYERLVDFDSQDKKETAYLNAVEDNKVKYLYRTNQANFSKIPGSPIDYWMPISLINIFDKKNFLKENIISKAGIVTGKDSKFIFFWTEVNFQHINLHPSDFNPDYLCFVPLAKGGEFNRWYGNNEYILNIKKLYTPNEVNTSVRRGDKNFYFKKAISWSYVTSGNPSFRIYQGFVFGTAAPEIMIKESSNNFIFLALLNSKITIYIMDFINPTINLPTGYVSNMPIELSIFNEKSNIDNIVKKSLNVKEHDNWHFEFSYHFSRHPLLNHIADDKQLFSTKLLESSYVCAKIVTIVPFRGHK